ncbi:hypothetical protein DFP72DRAFT_1123600 [Ephemerocybe angulata]|uniref:Uncharacterized protein n=1 Tax=Ephemerocybe angulata TaxID=980116 RepID=A0A8H6HXY9_9AGAR|nr:hypothetical protein DFP72DRAFT_1123600 [Tulosesus angulatus]
MLSATSTTVLPSAAPTLPADLRLEIVTHLPTNRLHEALQWCEDGRHVIEEELRRRVFDALAGFIPLKRCEEFFDRLHECEGAIIGSVVRAVLLVNSSVQPSRPPANLDVVTRLCLDDPMRTFFHELGYDSTVLHPRDRERGYVDLIERFEMVVDGKMNAIIPGSVIVFYPRLTFANDSLAVEGVEGGERTDNLTFAVSDTNAGWTKPCGIYCPTIWRKSVEDRGAASYSWSYLHPDAPKPSYWVKHPHPVEVFCSSEALTWRVHSRCHNSACPNMQLYNARLRYLNP